MKKLKSVIGLGLLSFSFLAASVSHAQQAKVVNPSTLCYPDFTESVESCKAAAETLTKMSNANVAIVSTCEHRENPTWSVPKECPRMESTTRYHVLTTKFILLK